jgi:polyhydroxyalkanoate synthase subunit PhaC
MTTENQASDAISQMFSTMLAQQSELAQKFFGTTDESTTPDANDTAAWADAAQKLQAMWLEFQSEQALKSLNPPAMFSDPSQWMTMAEGLFKNIPMAEGLFKNIPMAGAAQNLPEMQQNMMQDGMSLWQNILGQIGLGAAPTVSANPPRNDRRFANEAWQNQPAYTLLHQTYLMFAKQITALASQAGGDDPARKQQLVFATTALVDALSPSNFLLTNPQVLARIQETKGQSLVKGMQNLLGDLKRGQLTHTDPNAFKLGENIAATPGKVVYESDLFQIIQYTPTTENVLATPLLIFPPWINRFYILDLNPAKSFVRWAVEQGISTCIVSWKSADASMKDIIWDDYIRAQIEAIDVVRARLKTPAIHTIGYCVAGTTLAATLAILAKRGEADKVKSATFFTAQVDFTDSGDLKHFVDDKQIETIGHLSPDGYLDGRYMAATFNLLRGNDLIWSYVVNNYLLGQDYPAFDMLHWNGDTTNLPTKWHQAYLRDLYKDNRLVIPDSLSADGTPINLTRITTPLFIQAGREDHIAPPASVFQFTRHASGPCHFMLAGSGHIAGVVNPPAANKYQYWLNQGEYDTLDGFIAGAIEHKGSWWPHWLEWLRGQDDAEVPAKGLRVPGGKGDKVIEDAPGRYVKTR